MPKVSVIIPCYNHGKFIDETVNSVLNQTFQDFEIIVVNDGSTDRFTNKLLKCYLKPKTKVVQSKNQGLPAARNLAIKHAKGKYILPLDADDKIAATYLEKAVKILDKNPKVGFVSCWVKCFGAEQLIWKPKEPELILALAENVAAASSVFRKKIWVQTGGYDEKLFALEDWDFWISILEQGWKGKIIKAPLFFYRKRKKSMLNKLELKKRLMLYGMIIENHFSTYKHNWKEILIKQEETKSELEIYFKKSMQRKNINPIIKFILFPLRIIRHAFNSINEKK